MSQRQIPNEVESARGKLVYLYLRTEGTASLTDLQGALGLSQLTLLTVLRSLRDTGHVRRTNEGFATVSRPA
ncbi:TrmB family transcriptional regulator [Salarchaeum japonicum]|uniref:MarR family transcriptional regulator n=1 Tax=Salarchaeum japonicum TaxID=555573 RepID=A0AAV3T1C7_9EURY|nr:TrmB family transcriptional regulator [Salarchaeum japonicum]